MSQRKKYRPKQVNPTAHIQALHGVYILSKPDQLKQAMNLSASIDAISKNGGLKEDWMNVFDVINMVAVTNDEAKLMTGADEFIERCQDVCYEAMGRRKSGVQSLRASELQALRELQTLWADLLGTMTYADWHRITKETSLRVARLLTHGTGKADRVVEAA